jgi:hypothetical protein
MVVSLVVLYYFALYITYFLAWYSSVLSRLVAFLQDIDDFKNITITKYRSLEYLDDNTNDYGWLRSSVLWTFAGPLIIAPIICLLQLVLLAKDTKTHLKQLRRGQCDFVQSAQTIGNASIAGSSFHFGG